MKFTTVVGAAALAADQALAWTAAPRSINFPPDAVDILQWSNYPKLLKWLKDEPPTNGCTIAKARKRQEWSALSVGQRKEFISAVLCLMKKDPIIPADVVPGGRSRYDDFIATHMNQTLTIHATFSFLSWHRYYIWAYENALRDECGYTGNLPYWNWGKYADDPLHSPLFDGSDSSLSGDGSYVPYGGIPTLSPPPNDLIPPGNGGGCVTTGPFANITVNLGPVAPQNISGIPLNSRPDGYAYNPRCLRRDINVHSAAVTKTNYTYQLITAYDDIDRFQTHMQGDFANGEWGVHTGGHFTIGGDPGGDFYTSPGDPAFWLHHGMIDRVWWIWQMADMKTRTNTVAGTLTIFNTPPSRNGTLDDYIDLGYIAGPLKARELMDTMDGPFCYVYV